MARRALPVTAGLLLLAFTTPCFGQSATPGRLAAAKAEYLFTLSATGGPGVTVTLERGRAKRLLMVDAVMIMNDDGPVDIFAGPSVNGIGLWPQGAANHHCGTGEFACTVAGHWWLDLDNAEALNPGAFIGQPLTVTLFAGEAAGIGAAEVSMRVWMEKK